MKVVIAAVVVVAVLLSTGIVLFCNGYGPMAHRDRRLTGQAGAADAETRINEALRATMDGISPPLAYLGGGYEVNRYPQHWDGEPSLISDVTGHVDVRTRIAPGKLQALLDQIGRGWTHCLEPERYSDKYQGGARRVRLVCGGPDSPSFTFTASAPLAVDAPYDEVWFEASLFGVRYRPAHEYKPVPPLAKTPTGARDADVDDPYWSH
ncbi:hypothetical protein [Kitasatospora sp. NPDC047058]|uniref:hypothetical protein n=1 Tax=Kitasatospora sp. NPDC047058 TaxID=3155620 RepID=UPI0033F846B9